MRIESSCSCHIIKICFFPFYEQSWYRRKVDESAWAMGGRGWKGNCYHCIIWSFAQVTNELDLFFLPRFPFHKKMHKRHCYFALGSGKVSDLEVHPVLIWSSHVLNLCTALPLTSINQPLTILRDFILYFIPLCFPLRIS